MTSTVSDNILCSLYLLVWIITLIWYQYKNHAIDVGTAIIGSYVGYAFFSLLSINDSFFVIAYNPLKLFPYVYLYVMLMIALSPTIYHHLNPPNEIIDPNTRVLKITSVIIIVSALLLIPDIISNFGKGLLKLFVDSDAGNDAYLEQLESVEDSGSAIRNIPAIIFNALADLGVFFAFYFMTLKKKNYWLIIGLLISVLISILLTISQGLRGGVIISILTTIVGYLLFMRYMSHRIKRAFRVIGISIVIAIAFP